MQQQAVQSNELQGTQEWFNDRLGMPTASNYGAVLSEGKGITRARYKTKLVAERVTGVVKESYTSPAMEEGKRLEVYARVAYAAKTGNDVELVGFIKHPTIEAGASPDGLIGDDGLVEIKCVIQDVQIETIVSGKMPTIHTPQVQGQLWVTGRKWCDFVSFCNELEGDGRIFIVRVYRDEQYIKNLEEKVKKFLIDVEEMEEKYKANLKAKFY